MAEVHRSHKDFDCDNCANNHHCTEVVGDVRWPRSIGRAPYALFNIPGVIDSDVCLRPMVTPESVFYFKLFQHYKNNILPYSGGLLDQPAVYLQIMELIDSLLRE